MALFCTSPEKDELLSELADLINMFGPDSPEVETFIGCHEANPEFARLAYLSCTLKRALTADEPVISGRSIPVVDVGRLSPSLGRALEADRLQAPAEEHEAGTAGAAAPARRTMRLHPA
jgi:hypothetical protein